MRAEGLEPSRTFKPCGFSSHFGFRRPAGAGSWSGLYLHHSYVRIRCCPSSLYTFPDKIRAWLGIAISGFPDFEQFYAAGFPTGTQVSFKSAASADFATPA